MTISRTNAGRAAGLLLGSMAVLPIVLTSCNGAPSSPGTTSTAPDAAPTTTTNGCQPTPPPNLVLSTGRLFSLDAKQKEFVRPIEGSEAVVLGTLASPGGKRDLVLRSTWGDTKLAPAAWNLPAKGAARTQNDIVVCWNVATGPDNSCGTMPHPSTGLALDCARVVAGSVTERVSVPRGEAKALWLVEVRLNGTTVVVRYLRDTSGWLVGESGPDDGIYEISGEGLSFGAPVLIDKGSFAP